MLDRYSQGERRLNKMATPYFFRHVVQELKNREKPICPAMIHHRQDQVASRMMKNRDVITHYRLLIMNEIRDEKDPLMRARMKVIFGEVLRSF